MKIRILPSRRPCPPQSDCVINLFRKSRYNRFLQWKIFDWCFQVFNDLSPLISVSNLYFSFDFERRLWTTEWSESNKIRSYKIHESQSIPLYNLLEHLLISSWWKWLKSGFYTIFSFGKVMKTWFSLLWLNSNALKII